MTGMSSSLAPGAAARALAGTSVGVRVRIARVELDGEAAAWIGAVGLHDGEELVVLRRAALGGPLHVRTASGGEFAIGREVAEQIVVEPAEPAR
jgi:ferrous iron transport protein A